MRRLLLFSQIVLLVMCAVCVAEPPWRRHTIDDSSRGADGIRLADINGDGLSDLVTGWEEGGVIRVYQNPGPQHVSKPWPAVTVGKVKSPEDAVFVDLDADGNVDVVSCCEGKTQSVFVHWSPDAEHRLESTAWKTDIFPAVRNKSRWMFCLPMQVDGQHGIDLVLGSKEPNGVVGWLEAPEQPRKLEDWKWHSVFAAGWVMSIEQCDLVGDRGSDLLITDRKGPSRGLYLFEHVPQSPFLKSYKLGGDRHEVMFLDCQRKPKQRAEIVVATRDNGLLRFQQSAVGELDFDSMKGIPVAENTGTLKSVRWCDVDLNGRDDLVYSCENAHGDKSGVVWLEAPRNGKSDAWQRHEISGPEGVKFDLIQLLDLDKDGDLDVLTCEERTNLGVIWYENPTR